MIDFFRGEIKYYKQEHFEGIYFATDTKEILHNGEPYSGILKEGKSVEDITLENGVLTVIYTDKTIKTIEIESNKYQSNIDDESVSMTTTYGDFTVGTTVGDLKGKTYDELFDGILFPSINPTKSGDPVVSEFTLASNGPVELGTNVISISEADLNKQTWKTYNNNAAYAGDVTDITYEFKINRKIYKEISDLTDLTYEKLGNHTYKATVSYAKGIIPKNNKGVKIESLACPAGSTSTTRIVNVTVPWYATTNTAGVLTKQPLITWDTTSMIAGGTIGFELQPHTQNTPQQFKIPRKATNLQMYNTVAKKFEIIDLNFWEEIQSSEKINNFDQTYYTYTYTGANRGSVKLIVTF